jgi:hypothetical protein
MEILHSIIGIILAARMISFPFVAFSPILGNLFFVVLLFAGFWVVFSPMVSVWYQSRTGNVRSFQLVFRFRRLP